MDIIKISLLGVCGVILGFLMKGTKPEYACFITVGIGLVIMGLAVGKIYYLFESLGKIQETLPVDTEYISTLVKMIGITYIGQFSSGICKDAGYASTGGTDRSVLQIVCDGSEYAGTAGTSGYDTGISCMKKRNRSEEGIRRKRRAKVWWKARIVVLVMICTGLIQWPERMDTGVNGVCVFAQPVSGETTEADAVRQADSEGSASIDNSQEKQLTDQLELTDLQSMVDEMLGENSFSVTEAFHRLLSGEEVLSEESVREFLHSLLFSSLEKEKSLIVKLLLLLLFAAVFSGFAGAFDNGQIGEISFYVVYLLVFTLLMNSFSGLSASLLSILRWITEFMKELSPVYFYGSGCCIRSIYGCCFLSGSTSSGVAVSVDTGKCFASWSQLVYTS